MPDSPLFGIPMLEGGSDYPSPDATADAKQINDQFKYVEQFLGIKPVTSGALPSSPKTQQVVYETDTGKLKYWSGSAWVEIKVPTTGSTAERDAFWGSPANGSQRVALANQFPIWRNTDKGWIEQYFANDGDSAIGGYKAAVAAKEPGWYPIGGKLPYVLVEKNISQSSVNGTLTMTWNNTGYAEATDSTMYDKDQNTRIVVPVRGFYRLRGVIRTNGVNVMDMTIYKNGTPYNRGRYSNVGAVGAASHIFFDSTVYGTASEYFEIKVVSNTTTGTYSGSNGECWIEMQYMNPDWIPFNPPA